MGKVWYCPNCGYEVGSRGRCHACREKLVGSDLPELEPAGEDDEVGYRIGWWADRDRGRLIEFLNVLRIPHRFEEEELVVAVEDEERVDDLLEELSLGTSHSDETPHIGETAPGDASDDVESEGDDGTFLDEEPDLDDDGPAGEALRLLADAARRLTVDPTDMQADADVAEASAGVFMVDEFYGTDAETWAAVGRVTRRLLVALGAEEAMEDEIRLQASILSKLLADLAGDGPSHPDKSRGSGPDTAPLPNERESTSGEVLAGARQGTGRHQAGAGHQGVLGVGTVYELPGWLPEQRAQLGALFDGNDIPHEWDGDDLVVASAREEDAEALFDQVGAPVNGYDEEDDGDGGEARYHAIEELFSAAGRLAAAPDDLQRQEDVEVWAEEVEGPVPVGMDEVHWLRIINKIHALTAAVRSDADPDDVARDAADLQDLLRSVV